MTKNTSLPLISPSIHRSVIERHLARDAAGKTVPDAVIEEMRAAVGAGRQAAEEYARLHDAIMRVTTQTVAERHKRSRAAGFTLMTRATQLLDAARARAVDAVTVIEALGAKPPGPDDAVGAMLNGEVRAALRAMSHDQRAKALSQSLSGDHSVLLAAIAAPGMLAGLSDAESTLWRETWRRQKFAPQIERGGRLKAAIDDLDQAGAAFLKFVTDATDAAVVSAAQDAEARAAQAEVAAGVA